MAVTSPDSIWTPDSGDQYALTVDLARTADDVQDALNRRQRVLTGSTAPTGSSVVGDEFHDSSTGYTWKYMNGAWVIWDTPAVALTSLAIGWTAAVSPNGPTIHARAGRAYLGGGVLMGGTASVSDILTVPTVFRPNVTGVHWIGTTMGPTSNPFVAGLGVANTGQLSIHRLTVTPATGSSVPLVGSWKIVY